MQPRYKAARAMEGPSFCLDPSRNLRDKDLEPLCQMQPRYEAARAMEGPSFCLNFSRNLRDKDLGLCAFVGPLRRFRTLDKTCVCIAPGLAHGFRASADSGHSVSIRDGLARGFKASPDIVGCGHVFGKA